MEDGKTPEELEREHCERVTDEIDRGANATVYDYSGVVDIIMEERGAVRREMWASNAALQAERDAMRAELNGYKYTFARPFERQRTVIEQLTAQLERVTAERDTAREEEACSLDNVKLLVRALRAALERVTAERDAVVELACDRRDRLNFHLERNSKICAQLKTLRTAAERVLDSWDTDEDVNESHLALRAALDSTEPESEPLSPESAAKLVQGMEASRAGYVVPWSEPGQPTP